jgi:methyl-accepting chemotaxis protein
VGEQTRACEAILKLVESNLNEVIRIQRAADEQKSGTRTIVTSVEEIRASAERVKKSTGEQAAGSQMVSETISRTHEFAQQIKAAMFSEQEASANIVRSLHDISQVAVGNSGTVTDMEKTVRDFADLAGKLALEIERFRLPENDQA